MDPDRCLCGLATVFGTRSKNGTVWSLEMLTDWLALETAVPLKVDHGGLINS
jgi:hypothetical protein